MSRTSRIPYHQNVYDLLGWEPVEHVSVVKLIAEAEARCGRQFPAAVREFFAVSGNDDLASGYDYARGLDAIIRDWERWSGPHGQLCLGGYREQQSDLAIFDGDDNPVVYQFYESGALSQQGLRTRSSTSYTEYIFGQAIGLAYDTRDLSDYWLRTPSEPFQPPVIDFLTEQLDEPERTPRPGNVTTYTFRSPGGIIRVTADEPSLTDGLSAWWIHADTPERLAQLARLVLPFGTLRETLRADTDAARTVLDSLRG